MNRSRSSRTPPSRGTAPSTPGSTGLLDYLQAAGAIGAGVVGLTAYVYLLGGTVAWLRITAARLPSDNATVAFQDRTLLATGLKALFFELALLAILAFVVWIVWRAARHIDSQARKDQRHLVSYVIAILLGWLVAGLTIIVLLDKALGVYSGANAGFALLGFVAVGVGIGALDLTELVPRRIRQLTAEHPWIGPALWVVRVLSVALVVFAALVWMAVPLGITTLVLLALMQLDSRVDLLPRARGMRDLILPVLVLALALNAVIVPYLATPPVTFDRATVMTKENEEITGAFIGRSSEGVFLATCEQQNAVVSKEARIKLIPAENVKSVVLGGFRYSFDVGRRPSIYALTRYFVEGEPTRRADDGFQLDVRGDRKVCGVKGSS